MTTIPDSNNPVPTTLEPKPSMGKTVALGGTDISDERVTIIVLISPDGESDLTGSGSLVVVSSEPPEVVVLLVSNDSKLVDNGSVKYDLSEDTLALVSGAVFELVDSEGSVFLDD